MSISDILKHVVQRCTEALEGSFHSRDNEQSMLVAEKGAEGRESDDDDVDDEDYGAEESQEFVILVCFHHLIFI